jgi:MoxR-like ATPase
MSKAANTVNASVTANAVSVSRAKYLVQVAMKLALANPRRARQVMPIMLWGNPGLGKSQICEDLTKPLGMYYSRIEGGGSDPADVIGQRLADQKTFTMKYAVPETYPIKNSKMAEAYWDKDRNEFKGGILVLEELPTAEPQTRAAMLGLLNERRIGDTPGSNEFCDGLLIIATGNRKGNLNNGRMLPVQTNRMMHIDINPSGTEWGSDFQQYALSLGSTEGLADPARVARIRDEKYADFIKDLKNWEITDNTIHPHLLGYAMFNKDEIINAFPEKQDSPRGWISPRTLERLNIYFQAADRGLITDTFKESSDGRGGHSNDLETFVIAAAGPEQGEKILAFRKLAKDIKSADELLSSPTSAEKFRCASDTDRNNPDALQRDWAVTSAIAHKLATLRAQDFHWDQTKPNVTPADIPPNKFNPFIMAKCIDALASNGFKNRQDMAFSWIDAVATVIQRKGSDADP